jgi:G:T-mismatch repair DNA endonuclease (very short patch repair protein)
MTNDSKYCSKCDDILRKQYTKGKNNPAYKDGRTLKKHYCIDCGKEINSYLSIRCQKCNLIKLHNSNKGIKRESRKGILSYGYKDGHCITQYYCKICKKKICWQTKIYGTGLCKSCSRKKNWKDIDYRNKITKNALLGLQLKPNNPERILINILPNLFLYVGNGSVIIDGFNPDFINEQNKKIIEMYGDYWHNRKCSIQRDKIRLQTYKRHGYKTLIIWEHELKDLNKVKYRINKFIKK